MAQLPNYLRSHRKRLALSQDEVAFLLGTMSGAKVNRHERFVREPSLLAALGYAAIFGKSVTELFAGLYSRIEKQVVAQAKLLANRILRGRPNARAACKRQAIINLAAKLANKPLSHP